jgi:hypothetical protein
MFNRLNAAFLELERTRDLVTGSCSLDELHRVVNQLMCDALACSNASTPNPWDSQETSSESSLDELIEALANICIALFDSHDIPRERLLFLVDQALTRKTLPSAQTTH